LNVDLSSYIAAYDHGGSSGYVRLPFLDQYELIGVHTAKQHIEDFAVCVPPSAEVVVDYQHQICGTSQGYAHFQSGVALVPREENNL